MNSTLKDIAKSRWNSANLPESLPSSKAFSQRDKAEAQAKFPPLSEPVVSALEAAARALHESDVGKELARRALDMEPQEVLALADEVARIPEIQFAAELARKSNVFASQAIGDGEVLKDFLSKYAPQSMIVSLCGMVDLGIGVTGSIGLGYDLDDFSRRSIFVTGSIGIGVDAVIGVGQGVGLSANAYSSMTGAIVGADIGVADGAGFLLDGSIGVKAVPREYYPDQWTGVVYVLEGVGAGAEFYIGYTLLLVNQSLPDVVQPQGKCRTTISSITCKNADDSTGKDELYFEVKTDVESENIYRYPLWDYFSIGEGAKWEVGFTINFNSTFEVTLYNSETSGSNKITSFTVNAGDIPSQGNSKTLEYDNGSGAFHNHVHYHVDLYTPNYG